MTNEFQCNIDDDVLEKFQLALVLNKDDAKEVIEKYMMQYISNSFAITSQKYKTLISKDDKVSSTINLYTGKARLRIPKWAKRTNQNNHKIIKAYYQVKNELGDVPFEEMERRCKDECNYPDTYVRDFKGNFNQMKIDSPKSHGKVFELRNGNVVVWDYVKEVLEEYKEFFL